MSDAEPEVEQPTAGELLIALLDGTVSAFTRRPTRVRVKPTPLGLATGRLDVLSVEVRELATRGLIVDRLVVHAEDLRIEPGFPPRLKAGPIGFKATVVQDAIDRWTRTAHLPVRLALTPQGLLATAGVRGIKLSELEVTLAVSGPFLQLKPVRASMLGLPTPILGFLRGYLPLPPLPLGAHLARVEPGDGELTVWFDVDDVDEPLTPAIAASLRRRLRPRLRL
ncbi:MAG: hypothetical protein QOE63_865 [Acidimicrobiaceae bacterium]